MSNLKKLENNILKYNILQFLHMFLFFGAFITIYYVELNFTILKIGILASVLWLSSFIFEIPSGIVADLYGRKTSIIISNIFYFLWILFIGLSEKYYLFIFGVFFCGIRLAFKSGSDTALLYDTLKELKKEKEFGKYIGKSISYLLIGIAVSAPIGTVLVKYTSMNFVICISLIPALISIILSFMLIEPKCFDKPDKKPYKHFKESLFTVLKTKKLLWLSIFFSSVSALFTIIFDYFQIILNNFNLDISYFGFLLMFFLLISVIGSRKYSYIHSKIKDFKILKYLAIIFSISMILIGFLQNIFIFIFLFCIIELLYGIFMPLKEHFINDEIQSKNRATIFSIMGFFVSVIIILLQPIIGYVGDLVGIFYQFSIMGVLFGLFFLISLKNLKKHI